MLANPQRRQQSIKHAKLWQPSNSQQATTSSNDGTYSGISTPNAFYSEPPSKQIALQSTESGTQVSQKAHFLITPDTCIKSELWVRSPGACTCQWGRQKKKRELFICKIKLVRRTTSEIVPAGHEATWRVGHNHIAYVASWRCAWWNQGVRNVTTEQGKQKMKFHLAC